MIAIDWSVLDQYPENTIECACGAVYRSHGKLAIGDDGRPHIFTRKPCPHCGQSANNVRAMRSDPERQVLR